MAKEENKEFKNEVKSLSNMGVVFQKLVSKKNISSDTKSIEVKDLTFAVKKKILLNNVALSVKPGTIHGFLGPNGAGKTTTIKNIIDAYITRTKESSIKIMGIDNKKVESKRKYAYIPEYTSFPKHLSLKNYLITMAKFSGVSKMESIAKSKELITLLELDKHMDSNPNTFSSGMKKKVLLAQALLTDPEVIIMDEPAANLDPLARNMLFKSLKELTKIGVAIFISSHILAELEGLIEAITLLKNGNVVYSGTIKEMNDSFSSDGGSNVVVKIYSNEEAKLLKLVKGMEHTVSSQYVSVKFRDHSESSKLIELIGKNQININKIEFNNISLQDIYDREYGA